MSVHEQVGDQVVKGEVEGGEAWSDKHGRKVGEYVEVKHGEALVGKAPMAGEIFVVAVGGRSVIMRLSRWWSQAMGERRAVS